MNRDDIRSLTAYFRQKGPVVLLESQSSDHRWARRTYLAALPKVEIKGSATKAIIKKGSDEHIKTGNPWKILQKFNEAHEGWLFGYLGYDLKNQIEELTSGHTDPVGASDFYFMIPQFLLVFNHRDQSYELLQGKLPDEVDVRQCSQYLPATCEINNLRPQVSKESYRQRIKLAQQKIMEGEIYEVNLSHQMIADFKGSPVLLYDQMKQAGPVPFGAFLQNEELAICCQSPERFLRKEARRIISQPIKGTTGRGVSIRQDKALKKALSSSIKERAENLMIVDLVRNDLSRIAKPGSVKVPSLFDIESYKTVHQMVSTITAVSKTSDPFAIIKACFPMGSMTGAPKIRSMKIIEELETYRRGIYSGAIGYITPDQNFDFNVVIRTALLKQRSLFYSVGGAITADSDPEDEWEETLVKAKALTQVTDKQ